MIISKNFLRGNISMIDQVIFVMIICIRVQTPAELMKIFSILRHLVLSKKYHNRKTTGSRSVALFFMEQRFLRGVR